MIRAFQLAKEAGIPTAIRYFTEDEIIHAREVMMIGTTLDVLPVTEYENKKISSGQVGPVAKQLREMLIEDFKKGIAY